MEQQAALLNALDFAVDYFRKVQSERNEALTRLRQLEQEVNVLRVLTSGLRADRSSPLSTRRLSSAATIDLEGRFNRGCRDRVVKWLAATLRQSSDPDVRRWAAITLGVIGDSRTVPVLALAMQDANREVRREAVIALGRIGNASVVGSLAEALKDKDEEVRIKAMEALTKVGEPAIPAMIAALGAPDALVRRGASDTLAKIGEGAVPALTHSLLDNDDRHVRIEAVESLGKMGHERAVPPLVLALMDPDGDIQEMAAQALVSTGKPAVMPLVRVLRVAGNPVRARVIEVLLRIRGLAVKPLVELLGDQNPEVRLAVSETLVKIGRPALRPLKHALRSASPAVRLEAAAAIGMIGDPAAVLPLIRAATGKDRELRQKAFEALVRIGKPAAAPLAALFKDADTTVREQAAQALLEIGRPSFEALCCALYEVDFSSRWEAARVLSRLRSSGHLRGLHGQWERIVEETLLQAWFSSGWAQRRAERAGSSGDSKGAETTARLTQCLPPGRGDRGLGESRNIS